MHRGTLSQTAPWRMHQFFNDTCNQRIFYSQRWRSINYRASRRRVASHRVASHWRLNIAPSDWFPSLLHFFSFFFFLKRRPRKRERNARHSKFFFHYARRITNFETIHDDEIVAVFMVVRFWILTFAVSETRSYI